MHNATTQQSSARKIDWRKQPFWWVGAAGLVAAFLAGYTAWESLWVDELHSSWSVSGSFAEVAPRAQAGNQSPIYFWLLFAFARTLGSVGMPIGELVLRLPSLISWVAAIWVCSAVAGGSRPRRDVLAIEFGPALLVVAWIALDRIQLFYATEARVYAIVQLVSLLGWCCIGVLASPGESERLPADATTPRQERRADPRRAFVLLWCVLSTLLIYLHLLAALGVLWQWCFGAVVLRRPRAESPSSVTPKTWWLAGAWTMLSCCPAMVWAVPVWQRRGQWESFAGNPSLGSLLGLFPLAAFLVPILTFRMVDWAVAQMSEVSKQRGRQETRSIGSWMWLVAASGPWATAWLMTELEIAPIFHRRYVIVSAMPLVLLAACELRKIRLSALRWSAGLSVIIWLVVSQGTFTVWRHGHLVGWQRGEDWRGATGWVDQQWLPGDQLWCASGLIEGRQVSLPIDDRSNDYLSFPLRGLYEVADRRGTTIAPNALVNDPELWDDLWMQGSPAAVQDIWIVARGRALRLHRKLAVAGEEMRSRGGELEILVEPKEFGAVAVAKLRVLKEKE